MQDQWKEGKGMMEEARRTISHKGKMKLPSFFLPLLLVFAWEDVKAGGCTHIALASGTNC